MLTNTSKFCFRSLGLVIAAGLLMTACTPASRVDRPQLVAEPDKVSALLADAADRAANALQTLAAVEQAKAPTANLAPIPDAPPELRRAVTVSWVGPVDAIAQTLADRASYRFETLGDQPPVPVVVNLNVENRPIVEVLRDLGLQIGGRAKIRVDSARQTIELHYAPVTSS